MINLSDSNEFYVVKFNNDQYLMAKYDNYGEFDDHDLTIGIGDDMLFNTVYDAKFHAEEFMKCNLNIKRYKMSSYTIHKVEYTQTVKEIE